MKLKWMMKFLWPTATIMTLVPIGVSCSNKTHNKQITPINSNNEKQYNFERMNNMLVWDDEAVEKLDSQNIEFRKLAPHLYEIIDNFSYNQALIIRKFRKPARFLTSEEMSIKDEDTEFEKGLKTIYQNNKKFFEDLSLNTHKYIEDNIRVKVWDKSKEENRDKYDYFYIDETTLNNHQKLYHNLYNIFYNINDLGYGEDSMRRFHKDKNIKKLIISVINDYYKVNLPQGFQTRINDVKVSYNENEELILDFTQEITYQGKQIPKYLTQYININFNTLINPKNIKLNNGLNKKLSNENYDFDCSYTEYKSDNISGYKHTTYFIDEDRKIEPRKLPFEWNDYKYIIDDEELEM